MNLLSRLRAGAQASSEPLDFTEWLSYLTYGGLDYPILNQTMGGTPQKEIPPAFNGFSELAFKRNGVVFAAVVKRAQLFSEARFKFRPRRSVNSGDLFGGSALSLFETPWPRGTTSQLLTRMSMDGDLAGNCYVYKESATTLRVARPDWVTIVLGNPRVDGQVGDIDTEIVGYIYRPPVGEMKVLLPEMVAHFAPIPDPIFPFRGMSWIQPVIEEVISDNATTTHKRKYFENSCTANMIVQLGPNVTNKEDFDTWVEAFNKDHKGNRHAFKTLFLAGGADAKVVGGNLAEIDFASVQAHGETRIAIAAQIPPIILGISEGLDKSSYADYASAKRHLADGLLRPLWRYACGILAPLIEIPPGGDLWYDDRDIPWIKIDQQDAATVQQTQAATIASLILAGFDHDSVVKAVMSGDFSGLVHTGLFSVQLQPPGSPFTPTVNPPVAPASSNGHGKVPARDK